MNYTRREALQAMGTWAGAAMLARGARGETPPRKPNVVVIYVDDAGYGDLGCYGSKTIRTPRLDRMAAEGMCFTDFYCGAPVCSPSRAALLTGRYPPRTTINNVLFPMSKGGLPATEVTIADMLRAAGYATGCIGKWHLGHLPPFLPTRHGFDEYLGIPYSVDMTPLPLMRNEETIESPPNLDTLTKRYTEEAQAFIRKHKEKPFFLYIPHSMPHVPIHASDAFRGKSAQGLYGDVIEELDWSAGVVLDTLKECGIEKDTLVFFSSDNGPWLAKGKDAGTAGPLREGKNTTFEGGMREPGIAWWPGHIAPGQVTHEPASVIDLLPTFATLCGGKVPADRTIDGEDISGVLLGTGHRAHHDFFYCSAGKVEAVRSDKWKLKRAFKGGVYGKHIQNETLLIDLETDIGEEHNLAAEHPDIVARLEGMMVKFEAELNTGGHKPAVL